MLIMCELHSVFLQKKSDNDRFNANRFGNNIPEPIYLDK